MNAYKHAQVQRFASIELTSRIYPLRLMYSSERKRCFTCHLEQQTVAHSRLAISNAMVLSEKMIFCSLLNIGDLSNGLV